MSIYTTPLQFGYVLALSMTLLFWWRGYKEERLSDSLLGFVMLILALHVQDYTFGFAGINFLWQELNGFPRGVALLFGPSLYFYILAQVNRNFKLKRKHLIHLLPWLVFAMIDLAFFVQGPHAVQAWQSSEVNYYLGYVGTLVRWSSYIYYFSKCLHIYKRYRNWTQNHFSDQEVISFQWFRNLVYIMIAGMAFKELMGVIDNFMDLDFYQDWWWNLGLVGIIFYVGITGYAQHQPAALYFNIDASEKLVEKLDQKEWKPKILQLMEEQKIYLEPQLSLKDMANQLRSNPSVISAAINQNFGKNFNDFVNEYRVREFQTRQSLPENKNFTLLAIALDCGFNSKSTFNRSFKKITGKPPREAESV